jgi:NitT/TauT family transport system permease protein
MVWRLARSNERVFYGVLGFVGLASVWEITASLGLYRRSLLSTPTAIWRAGATDFGNGSIFPHIAISLQEFAIGFFVSLIVAIPLGLAIGWFRRVDYATSGLLSALNATPNVALIPLIVLIAGIGLESKVIVVFLSAFFAVMVTTTAGVQSIARRHLEITRSFGGSQWLAFRTVALPSTLPFILSGIRIGAGRALVGVVSAEFLSSNQGLGFYLGFFGQLLDTARLMLGIVLFGIFGIVIGELLRVVERRFEVWRPEIRA